MRKEDYSLIKRSDVVRLKVPFPDISSDLACEAHMYICYSQDNTTFQFVKCQRLKTKLITHNVIRHFWDETPDIRRNPFKSETRIDCDKLFATSTIAYDDRLKTTVRPDVCADVMYHVDEELALDGYVEHNVDGEDFESLNSLVHRI